MNTVETWERIVNDLRRYGAIEPALRLAEKSLEYAKADQRLLENSENN